jgi:hypothetical protein
MKALLIQDLKVRVQRQTTALKYLKKHEVASWINKAIEILFIHTRPRDDQTSFCFAEIVTNIGKTVLRQCGERQDSALAAKTGAFVLYTFYFYDIVAVYLTRGKNKHNIYLVKVVNEDLLARLFNELPLKEIEKLPWTEPPGDYNSPFHKSGLKLIKTNNPDVLRTVRPDTHPIIYDVVNKAQKVGWRVNKRVWEIAEWALENTQEAFNDIWEQASKAKKTKIREARTILDISERLKGKVFYHQYFLDFRGRKYNNTTYFHEQGSDLAKGLLLRADKKKLGKQGYFWFKVSLATCWGGPCGRLDEKNSDKIPLLDRAKWVESNKEIFLSYAENPKVNTGWMKADEPWTFLAHCFELKKMGKLPEYYECSLEGFLDGSCNGLQHLAALTLDEETAKHVNLVPTPFPGDLYMYVAEHVWAEINAIIQRLDTTEQIYLKHYVEEILELGKQIREATGEKRKELIKEIRILKEIQKERFDTAGYVFWSKIEKDKHKRKITKRNVMTISLDMAKLKPREFGEHPLLGTIPSQAYT